MINIFPLGLCEQGFKTINGIINAQKQRLGAHCLKAAPDNRLLLGQEERLPFDCCFVHYNYALSDSEFEIRSIPFGHVQ